MMMLELLIRQRRVRLAIVMICLAQSYGLLLAPVQRRTETSRRRDMAVRPYEGIRSSQRYTYRRKKENMAWRLQDRTKLYSRQPKTEEELWRSPKQWFADDVSSLKTTEDNEIEGRSLFRIGALGALLVGAGLVIQLSDETSVISNVWRSMNQLDFGTILSETAQRVEDMGPLGILYFMAVYVSAEVLALPAVPLTASAGYLFGAVRGTGIVLVAATIAAGISFLIGRFLLRGWVESIASESAQFRAIDNAVQREGFKIVLLLRLSPIFPFALSNYIYGLTAVDFFPYLAATLIGFAPGTALYVYGGEIASIVQDASSQASAAGTVAVSPFPWYIYAAFLGFGIALAAKVTEIASNALEESGLDSLSQQEPQSTARKNKNNSNNKWF